MRWFNKDHLTFFKHTVEYMSLIKSFLERNPQLSDEEVSIKLGVSKKKVRKIREKLNATKLPTTTSDKVLADANDNPDIVDNPVENLKKKLRQIDQAFEISRKEFLIDPNSDNANNISLMLNNIKDTLKELDTFNDFTLIAKDIVDRVLVYLTKTMMDIANARADAFIKDVSQYIPDNISYSIADYKKSFITELGKQLKDNYDNSIDELQHILNVDLEKFRTRKRIEPLKLTKKKR